MALIAQASYIANCSILQRRYSVFEILIFTDVRYCRFLTQSCELCGQIYSKIMEFILYRIFQNIIDIERKKMNPPPSRPLSVFLLNTCLISNSVSFGELKETFVQINQCLRNVLIQHKLLILHCSLVISALQHVIGQKIL